MGVTLQAWLQALQALLPTGMGISKDPNAKMTRLLESVAAVLLAAQVRLASLYAEWDPRRATSMLPDWERLLGLPDACAPLNQELGDRQKTAFARLTETGGQSRAYFLDLAARLGEPNCTITEFRPLHCNATCNDALYSEADAFVWRVNIPRAALNARWATCNSGCSSALQMYEPSLIECVMDERKPAHTHVQFAYAA